MKKAVKRKQLDFVARITEERQDLIHYKISVTITYRNTGKMIKGCPLQLGKRHQLLMDLPAVDVKRLGYLAALQYQDNLKAKRNRLNIKN
jgi:hypothetical protein